MKVVNSRTALALFFVFVVLPTPSFLSAGGLWHHNDIFWRILAQVAVDGLLFLFMRQYWWKQLPDAEQQQQQEGEQQDARQQSFQQSQQ